jgi:hypothetical protein
MLTAAWALRYALPERHPPPETTSHPALMVPPHTMTRFPPISSTSIYFRFRLYMNSLHRTTQHILLLTPKITHPSRGGGGPSRSKNFHACVYTFISSRTTSAIINCHQNVFIRREERGLKKKETYGMLILNTGSISWSVISMDVEVLYDASQERVYIVIKCLNNACDLIQQDLPSCSHIRQVRLCIVWLSRVGIYESSRRTV